MTEKLITTIETAEFDQIVEAFIARETKEMGELDAPLFYTALENIFQAFALPQTIELHAQLIGNQLNLFAPVKTQPGIEVHNNEISINNLRFVIRFVADNPLLSPA